MNAVASLADGLISELAAVVGEQHCLTDRAVTTSFTTDWTGRYAGDAVAVVRPGDAEEVAAVLSVCSAHEAAVIPQGGNTGLVGGSVPRKATHEERPQVVLSLRRLSGVARIDAASRLLEAPSGTTLAEAQQAALASGFHLGIDLAARDSATLGGMVATNAGGLQVVRYGPMRARLAGIEAVLADGTVVSHMSGLVKDNVGWDPAGILAGSEGTLAVITRVLMHLEPLSHYRVAALVALPDVATAVDLATGPLRSVASLEAVELTLRDGMDLVSQHAGLPAPIGSEKGAAAWLTVEVASGTDPTDELASALEDARVIDAAVGSDTASRARLWAYRERHTEAVSSIGVPHKLDVSVVPSRLTELVAGLAERVAAVDPSARIIVWGHVADGNVHVNVLGPAPEDYRPDDAVIGLVLELGGSISAEHGVGIAKMRWLRAARSAGSLELMARVKNALDPADLLNPGVLRP